MASPHLRLMSYEIFNEIMQRDITPPEESFSEEELFPAAHLGSTPLLDITLPHPSPKARSSLSLKYSERSEKSEEQENFSHTSPNKEMSPQPRMDVEMIKVDFEEYIVRNCGCEEMQELVNTLEREVVCLRRGIEERDAELEEEHSKLSKALLELTVKDSKARSLQDQVVKYESDIMELHESILSCNERYDSLLRHKEDEIILKERIIQDYLQSNSTLMEEVMLLRRQKIVTKQQLDRQHKLILQVERRSERIEDTRYISTPRLIYPLNVSMGFQQLRQQLVELMRHLNEQVERVKKEMCHSVMEMAKEMSSFMYHSQQSNLQKQAIHNERVELFKKEILRLKMELVQIQIERGIKQHKSNAPSKTQVSSQPLLSQPSQPTKILKKHILNAGKQINVTVSQDRVLKETSLNQRKSIQECHMLRNKRR